ncbi:hypothetical protein WJX74_008389 [Apatococcus lobatus]|uniref:Uncharacterized protein n=1 Tax=Apatococcus lobatus TaxID=904363 RepID=A0AAW1RPS4_9CHLO
MASETLPNLLACELVDPQIDEQEDQGYFFRRLGEICFQTARQADPCQPGSQQCVVAAGTLGLTAFSDGQGLYIAATSSLIQASSKGEEGKELPASDAASLCHAVLAMEGIVQLALSPDELMLAVCQLDEISCYHWSSFLTDRHQAKPLCTWSTADGSQMLQFSWGTARSRTCQVLASNNNIWLGRLHQALVLFPVPDGVTAAALSPMMPHLAYACGSEVRLARQEDGQELFRVDVHSQAAQEADGKASIQSLCWLGPRTLLAAGVITLEDGKLDGGILLQIHWLPGGDSLPEQVLVSEFMDPPPSVDASLLKGATAGGLHTAIVSAWNTVLAAHSLSYDEHIFVIETELDETAPTHIQVTGEKSAIRIPNAGDEENFICGLAMDFTSTGVDVPHLDPEKDDLQASPVLLVATVDGILRFYTFSHTDKTSGRLVQPPRSITSISPELLASGTEGTQLLQDAAASAESSTLPAPAVQPLSAFELVEQWDKQVDSQPAASSDQELEQATAADLPSDEDGLSDDEPVSPQERLALGTVESSSSSPVLPVLPGKVEARRPAGKPTSQLPEGPSQEAAAPAISVQPGAGWPGSWQSAADLLQDRAAAAVLPPDGDDISNDEDDAAAQNGADAQKDQAAATALPSNADDKTQANHEKAADHSQNGKDQAEQQRRDQAAAAPLPSDDDDGNADHGDNNDVENDSGSFGGTTAASHAPMHRVSWPMSTQSAESANAAAEQTSAGHGMGVSDSQPGTDESEGESAGSTSAVIHQPPGVGSVASHADDDSEDSTSASAMTPPGKQEPVDQADDSISSTSAPGTSSFVRSQPFGPTAGAARQTRAEETLARSSCSNEAPAGATKPSQGATREPLQPVGQSASASTSASLFTSSAQSKPAPLLDFPSAPFGSKATTSAQTSRSGSGVLPVSFSMPAFGQSATLPAFGQANVGVAPAAGQAATSWSFGQTAVASASAFGQAQASSPSTSSLTDAPPSFGLSAPASASMPSIGVPSSFLPSADPSATAASGPSSGRAASSQVPEIPTDAAGTGKRGAGFMQPSTAFGNTTADQPRSRQPSLHGALASMQGQQQVTPQATEHASSLKALQGPVAQPMSTSDDRLTLAPASFGRARQPAPLQPPEVNEPVPGPARPSALQVPKPGTAVTGGPPSFSAGFPAMPSAQAPGPFRVSAAAVPEGDRAVQQQYHRASSPADETVGHVRAARNGSQAIRQAAKTRVAQLKEGPKPQVPAPTPQLAGEGREVAAIEAAFLKSLHGTRELGAQRTLAEYDGEEDGPPSTRLGYGSLHEYIGTLHSQIKERSAEVTRAEEDISRLQQVCKEDHARQAALHHFAGQRTEVNAHEGHCCKALEPALADSVEGIEQRCVQLEDKADEVTSSLQSMKREGAAFELPSAAQLYSAINSQAKVAQMQTEHLAAMEDQMQEWGWLDSAASLAMAPTHSQHSPGLALIKGTLTSTTSSPWSPNPSTSPWLSVKKSPTLAQQRARRQLAPTSAADGSVPLSPWAGPQAEALRTAICRKAAGENGRVRVTRGRPLNLPQSPVPKPPEPRPPVMPQLASNLQPQATLQPSFAASAGRPATGPAPPRSKAKRQASSSLLSPVPSFAQMPYEGQYSEESLPAPFAPSQPAFGGRPHLGNHAAASAPSPSPSFGFPSATASFPPFSSGRTPDVVSSQSRGSDLSRAGFAADPPAKRSSSSRQPPMPSLAAVQDAQKLTQQAASGSTTSRAQAPQAPARPAKQVASGAQPPMPSLNAIQAAQSKFAHTLGSSGASQSTAVSAPPAVSAPVTSARTVTSGNGFNSGASAAAGQSKPSGLFSFGPGPNAPASSANFESGGASASGPSSSGGFNFGMPPSAASHGVLAAPTAATAAPAAAASQLPGAAFAGFNFAAPTTTTPGGSAAATAAAAAAPSQPPIPSMSAVKAAQRLSDSQQSKLASSGSVQTASAAPQSGAPAAGQPPLPSMAAMKQAQQLTTQLGQQPSAPTASKPAGGSTSAASAQALGGQPPIPSVSAVQDAQAAAAGALGSAVTSSQPAAGASPDVASSVEALASGAAASAPFGASAAASPATSAPASASHFGKLTSPALGGGSLFGALAASSAASQTQGGFGHSTGIQSPGSNVFSGSSAPASLQTAAALASGTSPGLFGQSAASSPATPPFGAQPSTAPMSTSPFATPSTQPAAPLSALTAQTASSGFGALTNPSGAFSFGTSASQSPSNFGTPQTASQPASVFGTGGPAPFGGGSSTSVFGVPQSSAAPSSMFGGSLGSNAPSSPSTPTASSSAFGSMGLGAPQPASSAPAASPFGRGLSFGTPVSPATPVFGNTASAAASAPSTPFFTPPAQQASGRTPFGALSPQANAMPASSPFGTPAFGTPSAPSTPFPNSSNGSVFGQPSPLDSSSGLFGQPSSPGQPSAFGSFSGAQASSPFGGATQPAAGSGLFGSSSTFGSPASPGGFGATNSPAFGASGTAGPFGAPASGGFGASATPGAFGAPAAPGSGGFGAPASIGGGFGRPAQQGGGFAGFANQQQGAQGFSTFASSQSGGGGFSNFASQASSGFGGMAAQGGGGFSAFGNTPSSSASPANSMWIAFARPSVEECRAVEASKEKGRRGHAHHGSLLLARARRKATKVDDDDDEEGDLDLGPTSRRSTDAPADSLDDEEEEALGDDDLPEELPLPDAEAEGDDKDEAVAETEVESVEDDAPKAKKKAGRKKAAPDESQQPEPRKPVPGWIRAQVAASGPKPFSIRGANNIANTLSAPAFVESVLTPAPEPEEAEEVEAEIVESLEQDVQFDEARAQREQEEEERLLAAQAEMFRESDEAAMASILAKREAEDTVDPDTDEIPEGVIFDADDFPEIAEANEAYREFLIEEGELEDDEAELEDDEADLEDDEAEAEQQALDEEVSSTSTADPAEQAQEAGPEQSAPAGPVDDDLYEVFRHPGQLYTPDLETLYGPEYRGFDPTAGRALGYTPFEFLSFKGDSSSEIDHHRVIQVDAPLAKCWQCWADRLNYCEWFDLINQLVFHTEDENLASYFMFYRFGKMPKVELYTTMDRVGWHEQRAIVEQSVDGMDMIAGAVFTESSPESTEIEFHLAYKIPDQLREYVGPTGIWGDVDDILTENLNTMKLWIESVDLDKLLKSRASDHSNMDRNIQEQRESMAAINKLAEERGANWEIQTVEQELEELHEDMEYVHERMAEADEAGTMNTREFWDPVAAMKYMGSKSDPTEGTSATAESEPAAAEKEASSKPPASKPGRKPKAKAASPAIGDKPSNDDETPKPKRGRGRAKKTAT